MNERELFEQLSAPISAPDRELMQYVDDYNRSYNAIFTDLTDIATYGSAIIDNPADVARNLIVNADEAADAFTAISSIILEHNSLLTAVDDWVLFASSTLADLQAKSFMIAQQDLLPTIGTEELQKYAENYLRGYSRGNLDFENDWITAGYSELLKDLVANILHQNPTVVDEAYDRARDSEITRDDPRENTTDTNLASYDANLSATIATIAPLLDSEEKITAYLSWYEAPSSPGKHLYDTFRTELSFLQLASKKQVREVGRKNEVPPVLRHHAFSEGFILSMAVATRLIPKDQEPLQVLESHIPALFEKFTTAMQEGMSADVALYSHHYATKNLPDLSTFASSIAKTLYPAPGEYSSDVNEKVSHFLSGFSVGYEVYHNYASFEKDFSDFVTSLDNGSMS